jgi:hypothetical protein
MTVENKKRIKSGFGEKTNQSYSYEKGAFLRITN